MRVSKESAHLVRNRSLVNAESVNSLSEQTVQSYLPLFSPFDSNGITPSKEIHLVKRCISRRFLDSSPPPASSLFHLISIFFSVFLIHFQIFLVRTFFVDSRRLLPGCTF